MLVLSITLLGYLLYTYPMWTFLYTGILAPPQWFDIVLSNSTLTVSWWAPPSLETSIPPTISHYILNNNITNISVIISNPKGCKPSMPCNFTLDLKNPSFVPAVGYFGGKPLTILDGNGTILFTLLAVNGAGNGDATSYIVTKRMQAG